MQRRPFASSSRPWCCESQSCERSVVDRQLGLELAQGATRRPEELLCDGTLVGRASRRGEVHAACQRHIGAVAGAGRVGFGILVGMNALAPDEHEVVRDNDLAYLQAQLSLSLAANGIKRSMWFLRGWPHRLAGCLDSQPVAETIVAEIKRDFMKWEKSKAAPRKKECEVLVFRGVFEKTSVAQFVEIFKATGWQYTPAVEQVLRRRYTGGTSTQICEDLFGSSKNSGHAHTGRLFRRPDRSIYICMKQQVLDQRHRYRPVPNDLVTLHMKSEKLGNDAFRASRKHRSLPFQDVVSTTQQTQWFSPSAQNTVLPFVDLETIAGVAGDDPAAFEVLMDLWVGQVCDLKHRLAFCLAASPGEAPLWYLAPLSVARHASLSHDARLRL